MVKAAENEAARFTTMLRKSRPIFQRLGDGSLVDLLLKGEEKPEKKAGASGQKASTGRKIHPFNFSAVSKFRHANPHHQTCINTKTKSIVGLGFEDESAEEAPTEPTAQAKKKRNRLQSKVAKTLDPLCDVSFQDVLNDAIEEYVEVGNGYIEVVREESSSTAAITGLHHLRAKYMHINVDTGDGDFHYEYDGDPDTVGSTKKFAAFGDLEHFMQRTKVKEGTRITEVIHLRKSSSLSKWYGFPDWLSGVASIELVQMMMQHTFDFFLNRGVPEFLAFFTGGTVDPKTWKKFEETMQGHIGLGQSYKSGAFNFNDPNIKVEVVKLGLDGQSDVGVFAEISDAVALNIVSAHRVPPLLAGILIPGKLGSTNELPNALKGFQALVVGPDQVSVTGILAKTLGNKQNNGGLALGPDDFMLRTITDEIDIGEMDTVSRMRETVPEAKANGRDIKAGLKKAIEDVELDEDAGVIVGNVLCAILERFGRKAA